MTQNDLWLVTFHRQAKRDIKLVQRSGLRAQAEALIELLKRNPYETPPPVEKLTGDLAGLYSRRLSLHHRLVYKILPERREVRVLRMWTHYE